MYGTEKLKALIIFGVKFGQALDKKLDDGKLTLWEGVGLVPLLKDIPNLIKDAGQAWKEYVDMDRVEKDELILFFSNQFDIKNDEVEDFIQQVLKCIMEMTALVNTVRKSVGGGGPGGDPDGKG